MPLIPKPNYNQIFASQAPDQDKPAVFNNYPLGWGPESRPNNGKPTIKGFNYLQQTSDLKDLWILQNGACLPYDESIEYADGAPVLKDGVIQYKTASGFKSRDSVTIPTYNNSADGVGPITGVAEGAYFNVRSSNDESYIDEYQNVGGSAVATGKSYPSGSYVETIAEYTALPFKQGKSYALYERVQLDNGDIAQSTIANNTTNPNVNMMGWIVVDNRIFSYASINDLKNVPAILLNQNIIYRLEGYIDGLTHGGGDFRWIVGNFSSQIADDPNNGIYVPCNNSSNGVFKRVISAEDFHSIYWFGARADGVSDDTSSYLELLKHASKEDVVKIDVGTKPFVVDLTSRTVPNISNKSSIFIKSMGANIIDKTAYSSSIPERDIFKATYCEQIKTIGAYKVTGQTPANQSVGLRGGRVMNIEFSNNVDLCIISRMNASPLVSQVTSKETPNKNWVVSIDSDDDYYGAITFNITAIDITIESKKSYRSFIFGGLKGKAFVSSSGQIGTSLFKHYDMCQQMEDFDSKFIVKNGNPYTPSASAVGIEMQSLSTNSARWKNVNVVLNVENNVNNPYTQNLFHISNIDMDGVVNRDHEVDNLVITGVLDGKGLSSNCIEYSRSRTFQNANFKPIFKNLKSDTDILVKEGERYVMEDCNIAGKLVSYNAEKPTAIMSRTLGSLAEPINILASRNGAVRALISIDYMIFENWLSQGNNYVVGRYEGYIIVTATGTTSLQLRKSFENVTGKAVTVSFGNSIGSGSNTAYLTVSAPEYALATTRGTFSTTVTYQDPAFQGRLVTV